jgi:DNA-directed RNA polymerase specialized sigma24 family protein
MTSSELIRAAEGDPLAFAALFDRHAMAIRQWLLARTRDISVANDLLAETFAYAWRHRRRFRGDGEDSGAAWLFGIAGNLELHHHRRGRVESSARARLAMAPLGGSRDVSDEALARIDAERLSPSIRAAFARLTVEQREAIGYRVLGAGFEPTPKRHEFEGPYAPRAWTAPSSPPAAPCELSASGLGGLSPVGGDVVLHVKGYRVFETRAFQSCADTYYSFGRSTLEAAVLLDAEHPGATPAGLPYVTRASGAAGVFEARGGVMRGGHAGNNNLTAERLPGAWLLVTGGSGPAQQLEVLRHLHATIHI